MLAACGSGETGGAPAQSDETASAITPSATRRRPVISWLKRHLVDFAWGLAFLPDGGMLVSEREGQVRYVAPGATSGADVSGGPETLVAGQGGYLDIAIDPEFESNRFVYLSYSKGTKSENATALMKARLSEDNLTFENPVDIYVAPTKRATSAHYGGRLLFLPDNTLLLGLGDGFRYMDEAQNPQNSHGTVMRLNRDGSAPDDNPFVGRDEGSTFIPSGTVMFRGSLMMPRPTQFMSLSMVPKLRRDRSRAIPQLWLADHYLWRQLRWQHHHDANRSAGDGATHCKMGAKHCALQHRVRDQ